LLSAIATILISCAQVNSPATPQLNSLKVGFSAWPGWLPWQVAAQTQRLPVQPAKAQMQWFDSYLESLKAMKSGQIQANSQTLSDTMVLTGLVEEAPKLDGLFDDRFVKAYAAQAKPA
jgi:NitT/TauT family transport system substrate-binding protein